MKFPSEVPWIVGYSISLYLSFVERDSSPLEGKSVLPALVSAAYSSFTSCSLGVSSEHPTNTRANQSHIQKQSHILPEENPERLTHISKSVSRIMQTVTQIIRFLTQIVQSVTRIYLWIRLFRNMLLCWKGYEYKIIAFCRWKTK